jgi:hypothetical protein
MELVLALYLTIRPHLEQTSSPGPLPPQVGSSPPDPVYLVTGTSRGSIFLPHSGQLPGVKLHKSGCLGQNHSVRTKATGAQ